MQLKIKQKKNLHSGCTELAVAGVTYSQFPSKVSFSPHYQKCISFTFLKFELQTYLV